MPPPHANARIVLFGRATVLACAAVLSFSALYELAVLCGFHPMLAVLFPIMVDAGVAVALASWRSSAFARRLTIALLASTVVGNAVAHILVAYGLKPHWIVVVLVGGLAPAVLAATWRLEAPAVQEPDKELDKERVQADVQVDVQVDVQDEEPAPELDTLDRARKLVATGGGRGTLQKELGLTEHQAKQVLRTVKAVAS